MAIVKDLLVLGQTNCIGDVQASEFIEGGVPLIAKYLTSATTNMSNYATSANVVNALSNKVDKVNGKGLSTNDYTAAEKTKLGNLTATIATTGASGYMSSAMVTKLNGIAAGAEVNVQSDWNATSGDALILNKPTIVTSANVVTALSNKVDKVNGKGLSTNDYTTTEKNKLAGIASGAEVNVQSDYNENDDTKDSYIKNRTHYRDVLSGNTILNITCTLDEYGNYTDAKNLLQNIDTDKRYTMTLTVNNSRYSYKGLLPIDMTPDSYMKYIGLSSNNLTNDQGLHVLGVYDLIPNGKYMFEATTISAVEFANSTVTINVSEVVVDSTLYDLLNPTDGNRLFHYESGVNFSSFTSEEMLSQAYNLEVGCNYSVNIDNTSWSGPAKQIQPNEAMYQYLTDGVYLGNLGLDVTGFHEVFTGATNTGENYLYLYLYQIGIAAFIISGMNETIRLSSSSNTSTFSVIPNEMYVYHKIDKKYLPEFNDTSIPTPTPSDGGKLLAVSSAGTYVLEDNVGTKIIMRNWSNQ